MTSTPSPPPSLDDPITVPECAICLCPVVPEAEPGDGAATAVQLECAHRFHRACIHKWTSEIMDPVDYYVQQNAKPCPTCRRKLNAATLGKIGFFDTPPDAPELDWMFGGSGDQRLSWAARQGDTATVRKLLANGHPMADVQDDVYAPDDDDRVSLCMLSNPMLEAIAFEGKPEVVRAFLETEEELDEEQEGYSKLIGDFRSSKTTGLCEAARRGNVELVNLFMDHGVQLNDPERDPSEETALHAAVDGGQRAMVAYLLERGADIEATFGDCYSEACTVGTPLMLACRFGHVEITKTLLGRGADPSHYDEGDYGALECAVKQYIENDDPDAARKKARQLELVRLLCSDPRVDMAHENECGDTVREALRTYYGKNPADPVHVAALEAALTAKRLKG